MQITSLWFSRAYNAYLKTQECNAESHQCVVKTLYSSISIGTEKLVFSGKVPFTLYQLMRCPYMEGNFSFPIKYGYSLVGKVIEGPADVKGKIVHLLHPHQDYCIVNKNDLHIVPDEVPAKVATLASNMETAINAVWDSQVTVGNSVLIVGFGTVGSLISRIIQSIPGTEVHIVEIGSGQRKIARDMGFRTIAPEQIKKNSYDIAFHTTANEKGLQTAIDSVAFEGKVMELSWYGDNPCNIRLGTSFHALRKQIVCSQVSHIAHPQRNHWDHKRRKELVFKLLRDSKYTQHITHSYRFAEIADFFNSKIDILQNRLSVVVEY